MFYFSPKITDFKMFMWSRKVVSITFVIKIAFYLMHFCLSQLFYIIKVEYANIDFVNALWIHSTESIGLKKGSVYKANLKI